MTRVLIVDDNPLIRELLRLVIEDRGNLEVVGEAENGEVGVAAAQWLTPDLVLLDVSMPVMDGLTALPVIQEVCPRALVVFLTAFEHDTVEFPTDVPHISKNNDITTIVERLECLALR